ncbi:nuclear transport factor 2 family protein [Nocardia xishanensis]|uniref:Nuclear transport factor 2 family protein n=1 Tax=Nocardia xishanensis TaxID=238964 RepID=A0ABW7XB76_9NOCA
MSEITYGSAQQIVQDFLLALESRKLERIMSCFSSNAVVVIPLSIDGRPDPWFTFEGTRQVTEYWTNAVRSLRRIGFSRKELTVSADATTVFCEAEGDMRRYEDGEEYRNVYVFRFDIASGKITRLLEYANPVTVANFGGGAVVENLHVPQ